jgi:hypothetical protein
LPGFDARLGAITDELCRTVEHGDPCRSVVASGIDIVTARSEEPNGALWKIDLDGLAVTEPAQTEAQAASRHGKLDDSVG